MEQLQNSTLNPSEAASSFPPHRRRPLRSRTYFALIGILSHRHHTNEVDGGDFELTSVSEENGSVASNEAHSNAVLVSSNDTVGKEVSIAENKEIVDIQDGGLDRNQATEPKSGHMNLLTNDEHVSIGDFPVVENQIGDCTIQVAKERESTDNLVDDPMDAFCGLEELEVDKGFSVDDYSEVLDSCFGMDMAIESTKTVVDGQENDAVLEVNISKEAEHELQLKEMELEKLIYSSGAVDSSCRQNADEEIEEGEISGEAGVVDDALYEDAASLGARATEIVQASECYFDKREFVSSHEDRVSGQHRMSDPSLINVVNSDCNSMMVERRMTAGKVQDFHFQAVVHNSHMETQSSGPIAPYSENLSPFGRILLGNAAENQMSDALEKDDGARKKKRKNGPLTKERRAKKKKNERLRRAEKNRKLGVKRLKLQPVVKPKTVSYCRHFLQGRCHEGEKCNFSHDTVPLTKSTPCGHFARHSCMKGDDCPFDHQLSKYPCKNYTSNGFCSRGSDCLFSHEMPANQSFSITPNTSKPEPDKGGSSTASKVSKPELNFSSPLNSSNSSKHKDNRGVFHQKVDAKIFPTGNSHSKSAVPKAPKGISFLSNGGMPLRDSSKHGQDKSTNDVDVGCRTIPVTSKLNEMSEKLTPKKPRGINFLSFVRPSSDDSGSKMFSNLLSNSINIEARRSAMDDNGEGKLTCSLPESVGILKVNNRQANQSLVGDVNEKANGTLLSVPTRLDEAIINERANFHFKKDDTPSSSVKERQSTLNKFQDPIKMPPLSYCGPSGQSKGGQSANFSSSFKTSFLLNAPSSVQRAVQSTLAFAANFEPDIKVGSKGS